MNTTLEKSEIEYFRNLSLETLPPEAKVGWIYIGVKPYYQGLTRFWGQNVETRQEIIKKHNHFDITLVGKYDSHYFMRLGDWQELFGKFPRKEWHHKWFPEKEY